MLYSVSPCSSVRCGCLGPLLVPMCLAISGQDFWLSAMFSFFSMAAFSFNKAIVIIRLYLADWNTFMTAGFEADSFFCLKMSAWEREKISWERDCNDSPLPKKWWGETACYTYPGASSEVLCLPSELRWEKCT